ncbi:MAG: HAD family hydrolase, partial [Desulfobacteraceae bacterium]|nr:HAD family hydrolase [Desulfobacteraceae bacterium]
MNYKAVIFDLDGTLLNSLEDIAKSANTVLA